MDLNYKVTGSGNALIILHGLFGSLDNWQSIAKKLADHFSVFSVDLRNHGRSPHDEKMDYKTMAEDVEYFMESHKLFNASIIGHSMGGKVAMKFAGLNPDLIKHLIIVDLAPVRYKPHHEYIFEALRNVDLYEVENRKEVENILSRSISEKSVVQFLMKGLYRKSSGDKVFDWRFNLESLYRHYDSILEEVSFEEAYSKEVLFIKGSRSPYIGNKEETAIRKLFPSAIIKEVPAGHWVHAENPSKFLEIVKDHLLN